MRKILGMTGVLIMTASLFISCMSQSTPQQNMSPTGVVTQLQPAVAAPSECRPTPFYRSHGTNQAGLAGIPWAKAEPPSSGVVAYLFFADTGSSESQTYRPLHTGGRYSDGSSTKILWIIDNPHASDTVEITGKKLLAANEMFQQTFPMALSPASTYPSTVNVPTAGCWRFDLKSGTVTATIIFWVTGS
jgi:hypothetical protein